MIKTNKLKLSDGKSYKIYFNKKKFHDLNLSFIKKKIEMKNVGMVRYCLHKSEKDLIQESIIATKGFRYFRTHKHPKNKCETYHIMEGKIIICLIDDSRKILKRKIISSKTDTKIFHIDPNIFHLIVPISKIAIWHEVSVGPFEKNKKFIIFDQTSPDYNSTNNKIISYCNKVSGINHFKNKIAK